MLLLLDTLLMAGKSSMTGRSLRRFMWFAGGFLIAALAVLVTTDGLAQTQTSRSKSAAKSADLAGPADYRSQHFFLHTDLAPADAQELLDRLEYMLSIISAYWGRPSSGIIECYVVDDLSKWPSGSLDPDGVRSIKNEAGVTISRKLGNANSFLAKATVYATAKRGVAQHEAVHAYCHQAFGTTGPVWYSEGMAEMGQYWKKGEKAVTCDPVIVEYLKASEPKSLNEIVNGFEATGDSWQNYAWRWALCHLLANNTNYAAKFRPLGLAILSEKNASFEQAYGDMADEISFEYKFFLTHLDIGYRADLCSWDWKRKFLVLKGPLSVTAKVHAQRGWQATGATLLADQPYEINAKGTWQISADGKPLNADGDAEGNGRLEGVLLDKFALGEPFELKAASTYTPAAKGNLYLRCKDAWNELADNKGQITVKLKAQAKK
jgi:hypothetical protein